MRKGFFEDVSFGVSVIGQWVLVLIGIIAIVMEFIVLPGMAVIDAINFWDVDSIIRGVVFACTCIAIGCLIIKFCDNKGKGVLCLLILCNIVSLFCITRVFFIHVVIEMVLFCFCMYLNRDNDSMVYPIEPRSEVFNYTKCPVLHFKEFKLHKSEASFTIEKKAEEMNFLIRRLKCIKLNESERSFRSNFSWKVINVEQLMHNMEISGLTKENIKFLENYKNTSIIPDEYFLNEFTYQANVISNGTFSRDEVTKTIEKRESLERPTREENLVINFYNAAEFMVKWKKECPHICGWQETMEYCAGVLSYGNNRRSLDDIKKSFMPIMFEFSNETKKYLSNKFVWCAVIFGRLVSKASEEKFDMRKIVLLLNILLLFNDYSPVIIMNEEKQEFLEVISKAKEDDYAPLIQFLFRKEYNPGILCA